MATVLPLATKLKIETTIKGLKEVFWKENSISLICNSNTTAQAIAIAIDDFATITIPQTQANIQGIQLDADKVDLKCRTNNPDTVLQVLSQYLSQTKQYEIPLRIERLEKDNRRAIKIPNRFAQGTCSIL